MNDLTAEEREFVIWALGYIEGAVPNERTSEKAAVIAEKLKDQASPRATSHPGRGKA